MNTTKNYTACCGPSRSNDPAPFFWVLFCDECDFDGNPVAGYQVAAGYVQMREEGYTEAARWLPGGWALRTATDSDDTEAFAACGVVQ